jgi:hypothetical protein
MPLKIDSVAPLNPENFWGGPVNEGQKPAGSENVPPPTAPPGGKTGFAPETTRPTPIGVSEMPALPKAGVELARLVLFIAAGSILLLAVYLVFMDVSIGRDVHTQYEQILNPKRIGSELFALDRLQHLLDDLAAARKDPAWQMSAESHQNAEGVLKMIEALPSVASTQKTQLEECLLQLPTGASRNDKLDRCVGIIESIKHEALEAAAFATNAQVAGESAAKMNEYRQSLHTFWIQAAQLILLNLLLPLLTALFGYVFGTQQAQLTS